MPVGSVLNGNETPVPITGLYGGALSYQLMVYPARFPFKEANGRNSFVESQSVSQPTGKRFSIGLSLIAWDAELLQPVRLSSIETI